jgi:hypothetical protein
MKTKLQAVATGPLLAGIRSTSGKFVSNEKGELSLLQHALGICKYDSGTGIVTARDPGRGIKGQSAEELTVTVEGLVNGWVYTTRDQMGAEAKNSVAGDEIRMQIYALKSFSIKFG